MDWKLDKEGLEKAAEALHNEKYPAWLWGTNKELQQHYRGQVTAAVTAYLGHTEVSTVEELDALPVGTVVLNQYGSAWQRGGRNWYLAGAPGGQKAVPYLPARVIYRPAS